MPDKTWRFSKFSDTSDEAKALAKKCAVSPVVAAVALNRGICDPKQLVEFLIKPVEMLHSPFLMKDMNECVSHIDAAINEHQRIFVYGDYDVDGITSTSIFIKYLAYRGVTANFYIPDRVDEGYGLSISAIDTIHKLGCDLIITVDTGISAAEEIKYAKSLGMDIVVTDHHSCVGELPDCPVVNPHRPDCDYPFKGLAGVGVAFKVICALEGGSSDKMLEMFGDLVTMGTIADIVEMLDENRAIVKYGLNKMMTAPNMGLNALIAVTGAKNINSTVIGFTLGPRINAAGRMGDAAEAVKLFTSEDPEECTKIAEFLDSENKNRQALERDIYAKAIKVIESDPSAESKKVLVVSGEAWHHGVIGIVASRVTDRFSKPCIMLSIENDTAKGSGRSINGFNLLDSLCSCRELFTKFGGHEFAAGVTLPAENIEKLDVALNEYADDLSEKSEFAPVVDIDFEISAKNITANAIDELDMLEPFGAGNPKPCFAICGAKIINYRFMGENNKHIKFVVEKDGLSFDIVAFSKAELADYFLVGDIVDVAGSLSINEWNNIRRAQMFFVDMQLSSKELVPESVVPERGDMVALYTYLKRNSSRGIYKCFYEVMPRKLSYETSAVFNCEKLKNSLDIFAELRLMSYTFNKNYIEIYLIDNDGRKVDLESSEKLKQLREN